MTYFTKYYLYLHAIAVFDNMEVKIKVTNNSGMVLAYEGEEQIGQLDFSFKDNVMSIEHTHAFKGYEGQGVATAMMTMANDYAITHELKVLPICSYAKIWYLRHPQFSDILDKQADTNI